MMKKFYKCNNCEKYYMVYGGNLEEIEEKVNKLRNEKGELICNCPPEKEVDEKERERERQRRVEYAKVMDEAAENFAKLLIN